MTEMVQHNSIRSSEISRGQLLSWANVPALSRTIGGRTQTRREGRSI